MLANLFFHLIYVFVNTLFNGIFGAADVSMDTGIGGALNQVGGYLAIVSSVIPVAIIMGTFVGVHVVVEGYIFGYKIVMWVVRRIPTQS